MHKYIVLGPPGSGKGTQAKLLAEDYDFVHISVGEIFRWHMQNHTKLAARIQRIVDAGELVSDDIVDEIVRDRLALHDWNFGFILDGFPRNRCQAAFFLESYDIDAVILIDVSEETVRQRISMRRLCATCGLDYNLASSPPKSDGICDGCGGELSIRSDDAPEAVHDRMVDYKQRIDPIIDLFRKKELVVVVDGSAPADEVQASIRRLTRLSVPKKKSTASRRTA